MGRYTINSASTFRLSKTLGQEVSYLTKIEVTKRLSLRKKNLSTKNDELKQSDHFVFTRFFCWASEKYNIRITVTEKNR